MGGKKRNVIAKKNSVGQTGDNGGSSHSSIQTPALCFSRSSGLLSTHGEEEGESFEGVQKIGSSSGGRTTVKFPKMRVTRGTGCDIGRLSPHLQSCSVIRVSHWSQWGYSTSLISQMSCSPIRAPSRHLLRSPRRLCPGTPIKSCQRRGRRATNKAVC